MGLRLLQKDWDEQCPLEFRNTIGGWLTVMNNRASGG